MSIKLMSQVWDIEDKELKDSRLLALLAFSDYAGDNGECWPSVPAIAKRARISERQAQRTVGWLVERGYIEIVTKGGKGQGNRTFYRVTLKGDTGDAKGDNLSPIPDPVRVTPVTLKGDMGDAPYIEPSIEPSVREKRVAAPPPTPVAPAIVVFQEVWRKKPRLEQYPTILAAVTDIELWREACTAWRDKGFYYLNITGQLEWYREPHRFRHPVPKTTTNDYTQRASKVQAGLDAIDRVFNRMAEQGVLS